MENHSSFPEIQTALLDELFDGVYILDRARKIVFWNRGAELISGYSRSRMLGRFCYEGPLQHEDFKNCRLCQGNCIAQRAMDEGIPIKEVVYLHHAEGFLIPVETHVRPLRDITGKVAYAIEIFRDISHWKKVEELSIEKDRLMGILAHDIRNPLTVIQSYAFLLNKNPDARIKSFVEPILRKAKLASSLVDDLLNAQAIENGTVHLTIQDVDVESVLKESISNFSGPAEEKQIRLNLHVETPNVHMCSDPHRLEEIFNNLISNAIHYSPRNTMINLVLRADDTAVDITIEDQGVGISVADQEKLFRAFGKTSNQPTAGEKSHGLGLYIVKKLVDLFSGTIKVVSESGKGTTFILRLPFSGCSLQEPSLPDQPDIEKS
jgi:PAS domain S-box-containing protein